jgi:hypothetical protein
LPATGGADAARGGAAGGFAGSGGGSGGVGGAICPPPLSTFPCAPTYDQQLTQTTCGLSSGRITTGQCDSGWVWFCQTLPLYDCVYDADKRLVGAEWCDDVRTSVFRGCSVSAAPLGNCVQSSGYTRGCGLGDLGKSDAGQDAGAVCSPLDLATQCPGANNDECQPTWAAVLSHPLCEGNPLESGPLTNEVHVDCDTYHVRQIEHAGWGELYYYDLTSGALVAIYTNAGKGACYGPPGGIQTSCSVPTPVCTLSGGVLSAVGDAGSLADAGAGTCLPAGPSAIFPSVFPNAPCAREGGAACYASCTLGNNEYKYVGCVSGSSDFNRCYASCSECP